MNKQQILDNLNIIDFYKTFIPSLKVNGKTEALGLCCFHDDHNPSLSVNVQTGLFHCFSCDAKGDIFTFYQRYKDADFPTALREIAEMTGTNTDTKPRVVAKFEYQDENGKTLYIKARLEPGRSGRPKEFVFKHLEGSSWVTGRGCEPVLYRLPEIIKSNYCFIVEGEAKADILTSRGLVATCLDSGANSPVKNEHIQILGAKEKIVILPDNDTAGKNYAYKIANALHGKVKELKLVELPGLKEKEDIIDWDKIQGNDKAKLIEIVRNAPVWTFKVDEVENKRDSTKMILTPLSVLFKEPEENVSWAVDDMLPTGGFSIVVAKPKVGKSTFARSLALNAARGEPFLNRGVTKGTVVYLALEDKRARAKATFSRYGSFGSGGDSYLYRGNTR